MQQMNRQICCCCSRFQVTSTKIISCAHPPRSFVNVCVPILQNLHISQFARSRHFHSCVIQSFTHPFLPPTSYCRFLSTPSAAFSRHSSVPLPPKILITNFSLAPVRSIYFFLSIRLLLRCQKRREIACCVRISDDSATKRRRVIRVIGGSGWRRMKKGTSFNVIYLFHPFNGRVVYAP